MNEANFKRNESRWAHLHLIIQDQFPHSKFFGVRVAGGAVVSFERIQFIRILNRQEAALDGPVPREFNEQWRRFVQFCAQIEDAVLPEVHFRDGDPYLIQMEQSGAILDAEDTQGGERAQRDGRLAMA